MAQVNQPEVWLRGPVTNVPPLLQPVAHALLQMREEVNALMEDFPEVLLWERPANVASAGFHLQHIAGVIDRLFTYARGEILSQSQTEALNSEGKNNNTNLPDLLHALHERVERALEQLRATDEEALLEVRGVGRKQLPSTVLGLLVHAAEHSQRHLGQLIVTARIIKHMHGTNTKS